MSENQYWCQINTKIQLITAVAANTAAALRSPAPYKAAAEIRNSKSETTGSHGHAIRLFACGAIKTLQKTITSSGMPSPRSHFIKLVFPA